MGLRFGGLFTGLLRVSGGGLAGLRVSGGGFAGLRLRGEGARGGDTCSSGLNDGG